MSDAADKVIDFMAGVSFTPYEANRIFAELWLRANRGKPRDTWVPAGFERVAYAYSISNTPEKPNDLG